MSAPEPRQSSAALFPGIPAGPAVREVLAVCAEDFDRHRNAVMASDDPGGPHGARVALRRLRTALLAFRPFLRRRARRAAAQEARTLFRLLGELRDADVLAETGADGPSAEVLAEEAALARARVRTALEEMGAAEFAGRVDGLTAGGDWCRRSARPRAGLPVAAPAAAALQEAWEAARGHGKRVSRMDTEQRHGFRKDLKALRYLTDFFGPLWPGRRQKRFLKRLKRLQDALGTLNDLAVAEDRLGCVGQAGRAVQADEAMAVAERDWKRLRRMRRWW